MHTEPHLAKINHQFDQIPFTEKTAQHAYVNHHQWEAISKIENVENLTGQSIFSTNKKKKRGRRNNCRLKTSNKCNVCTLFGP